MFVVGVHDMVTAVKPYWISARFYGMLAVVSLVKTKKPCMISRNVY